MGVDHGGGRGDKSPRIWSSWTLMQIPPQILSYRYKKERSVAFKKRQNPPAEALPRTPLGRRHPSPYPNPLGTDPPSALAMRPPLVEFHPDLRITVVLLL